MRGELLIVGGGGHARAIIDIVEKADDYTISGLIDSLQPRDVCRYGHKVLGGEKETRDICEQFGVRNIVVAIGDNFRRQEITEQIKKDVPEVRFISFRHPSAVIGADVEIGDGTVIMPGVVVINGCRISEGCILNTASVIDHDGIMQAWASLAPGAVTGGRVRIGERSSIGLGTKVIQNITIGTDTVIGAGAVVVRDVPDNVVAYGVPCRVIRSRTRDEKYL